METWGGGFLLKNGTSWEKGMFMRKGAHFKEKRARCLVKRPIFKKGKACF